MYVKGLIFKFLNMYSSVKPCISYNHLQFTLPYTKNKSSNPYLPNLMVLPCPIQLDLSGILFSVNNFSFIWVMPILLIVSVLLYCLNFLYIHYIQTISQQAQLQAVVDHLELLHSNDKQNSDKHQFLFIDTFYV